MTENYGRNPQSCESTPLVSLQENEACEDSEAALWKEHDQPWPASFERSINLLASPIIRSRSVGHFTSSPKPGATPFGAMLRMQLHQPGGPGGDSRLLRPYGNNAERSIEDFQRLVDKVHSMDDLQHSGAGKTIDAKAYRHRILQNKAHNPTAEEISLATMSPGYRREKLLMSLKNEQQEAVGTEGKATFFESLFNMANILMGVGILGLPYVYKSAGWFGGAFVSIFFGFVTWKTSILIGRELNGDPRPSTFFDDSPYKSPLVPGSDPNARMLKPLKSFPDIARAAFGETGCFILSVILYFELFSCLSIFFVSLGDHLSTLFPSVPMTYHMVIMAFAVTVPTTLLRTTKLLSYLSLVGIFATVAVVLAVLFSALLNGDITESLAESRGIEEPGPYRDNWNTSGLPVALGLIAYCFSGHAIVPSIYSSMKKPQEFERMIDWTFLIVIGCSFVVAISGYFMFGNFVSDQITISLAEYATETGRGHLAMKMLTWLMILTAFSKFTLTMFPLAIGFEEIIAPYVSSDKLMETASSIIKLVLIVFALLVAIFIPSFSFLCSLVGMICTMAVSCIFPAAAHLKLFGPRLSITEKIVDWILVVFGSVMAVMGTIATIRA